MVIITSSYSTYWLYYLPSNNCHLRALCLFQYTFLTLLHWSNMHILNAAVRWEYTDLSYPLRADHPSAPPSTRFSCQTCRQGHASSLLMGQNCCNYAHKHFLSPRGGQLLFWRAAARVDLTLKLPTFMEKKAPHFIPQAWWQQLHTLTCGANLRINWVSSCICPITCSWCPVVKSSVPWLKAALKKHL